MIADNIHYQHGVKSQFYERNMKYMNPFEKATETINGLDRSASAEGLAKLILTLYNDAHPFSFSECTRSLDSDNLRLALQLINYYLTNGEDASVINAGNTICENWPHLIELSKAGSDAKADVLRKWREVITEDLDD